MFHAKKLIVGLCLLVVSWQIAPATSPAEPPSGTTQTGIFPDTIAGRMAKGYIEAFNSGDAEIMAAFEASHRAKSALERVSMKDRMKRYSEFYHDWGRLDVLGVVVDGERDITVSADGSTGVALVMDFELEPEPPYGLVSIRISLSAMPGMLTGTYGSIDDKVRAETVEKIAADLDKSYVYPEVGTRMAEAIRKNLADGKYDKLESAGLFASVLTKDLQAISKDKHLTVGVGTGGGGCGAAPADDESWWAPDKYDNYGFEQVSHLPGNIGYLKLNMFHDGAESEPTAAAAMNFLANSDALIIDLRENGGGSPHMIAFLSGYLFDERTHLNSFYYRPTDSTSETWTRTDVPGKRLGQKVPVYVLTSAYTFSGAEEFTYNLKHLKRATIVGETTGGGAHPVERHEVNEMFTLMVPFGRAINPVTKTNWEGVGVKPQIECGASDALLVAQKDALAKLIDANKDAPEQRKLSLRSALGRVEDELAQADRSVAAGAKSTPKVVGCGGGR